jgi:modulator of FtsH protease
MVAPLDPAWTEFFATAGDAAATLVGLIIVAVSVNLQRILAYPQLPSRAGAGIAALLLSLGVSMAALIPQTGAALGLEVIGFAAAVWTLQLWAAHQMIIARPQQSRPLFELVLAIGVGQVQVLLFLIGGAAMLAGQGGAYWLAAGVIATCAAAVFNAWILLVEIMR